ncbi:MAG: EAL domain-containing protein, partial [Rickettsiales bacterium]|nr:EAL domain-containing protein [Rickettsiales bacterium]
MAYVWEPETGAFSWQGNASSVLPEIIARAIRNRSDLDAYIHPEDKLTVRQLYHRVQEEGACTRNYRLCVNQQTIDVEETAAIERNGNTRRIYGVLRRIPELMKTHSGSYHSYNLFYDFMQSLELIIARCLSAQQEGLIIQFTIDNLANVIALNGMEKTEEMMGVLQENLTSIVRDGGMLERLSVNQFVMVLPNHRKEELETLVDILYQILAKARKNSHIGSQFLKCSSGSVCFPEDGRTAGDLMQKLFLALEDAKLKLTSSHRSYAEIKQNHGFMEEHDQAVATIQSAINEKRLLLAYQPIIEAQSGQVTSYETLLRMRDADGNICSAGPLIPAAEEAGLIDFIDQKVLELVVEDLINHPSVTLNLNVSSLSTDNPKWLRACTRLLKDDDVARRL